MQNQTNVDAASMHGFVHWSDLTDSEIASLILHGCKELEQRFTQEKSRTIQNVKSLWPSLKEALTLNGRRYSKTHWDGPTWPEWANQPVLPLDSYHGKPKNKTEALSIALTYGDGHWATVGELYMWVAGTGPIVWRAMHNFGYGGKFPKVGFGYKSIQ